MSESSDNILGSGSDAEVGAPKPKRKSGPLRTTFLSTSSESSDAEAAVPPTPARSQSEPSSSQNRNLMIELGLSSDEDDNEAAPVDMSKTADSSKHSSQLFNSLSEEDSVVESPQYSDFEATSTRTAHNSTSQALFGEEISSSSSSDNDVSSNNESQTETHGVKNRDLLGLGSTGDSEGVETGDEVSVRKQEILEEHVVDDHDDEFLDSVAGDELGGEGGPEGAQEGTQDGAQEGAQEGADMFLSDADDEQVERGSPPEKVQSVPAQMPKCALKMGQDMFYVKLPNFLSIDTRPFDPDYYEYEGDDEEIMDEEGRKRLKLKVENTIRWRRSKTEDGEEVRESNARLVKWKNGTMSLYLGNEIFDVSQLKMEDRCNHLYLMQSSGLQAQAIFSKKLNIKPCSTDSQTHRKITLSIAERVSRTQKLRIMPAGGDPELRRSELQKEEDKRVKAEKEVLRQQRNKNRKKLQSGQKLSRRFLEENDDFSDDGTSINAVRRKYKQAKKVANKKRKGSIDDFIDSDEKISWKGSDSNGEEEMTSSSEEKEASSDASLDIGTRKRQSSYGDDAEGLKRKKVLDDSGSSLDDSA